MKYTLIAALGASMVAGCATVAVFTIENRLQELGLSQKNASCMAEELDDRLNDDELSEFARFTVNLTRRESPLAALDALSSIQNPTIARAVGASGLICVLRG